MPTDNTDVHLDIPVTALKVRAGAYKTMDMYNICKNKFITSQDEILNTFHYHASINLNIGYK